MDQEQLDRRLARIARVPFRAKFHLRARELARMEGMMVGYSSGAALQALEQIQDELTEDDIVVLLFSDHGSKYATKFFSDKWMIEQGFMEAPEVKAV